MSKNSTFDYERAAALFNIVQMVANIGPQYTSISAEAMSELKEMNDELVEVQKKRAARERDRNVVPGQPMDSGNPQPKRIFPQDSGVKEEHDPPTIQRKA